MSTLKQLLVVYILPCQSVPVIFELKMCKDCFGETARASKRAGTRPTSTLSPEEKLERPNISIHPEGRKPKYGPVRSWALSLLSQWRSRGITTTAISLASRKGKNTTAMRNFSYIYIPFSKKIESFYYSEMTVLYSRAIIYSTYVGDVKIPHHRVPVQQIIWKRTDSDKKKI